MNRIWIEPGRLLYDQNNRHRDQWSVLGNRKYHLNFAGSHTERLRRIRKLNFKKKLFQIIIPAHLPPPLHSVIRKKPTAIRNLVLILDKQPSHPSVDSGMIMK